MRKTTGLLAIAAIAAFGFVGPALANGDDNHGPKGYEPGTGSSQTCDQASHTIAYDGPTRLWPPNHRDVQGTVIATGHPTDDVTLTVTGWDNDTNQDSDFAASEAPPSTNGSTSSDLTFVRERTGQAKDGRTYTIRADATFSDTTQTCTRYFCVIVPHDMRQANRSGECTPDETPGA